MKLATKEATKQTAVIILDNFDYDYIYIQELDYLIVSRPYAELNGIKSCH